MKLINELKNEFKNIIFDECYDVIEEAKQKNILAFFKYTYSSVWLDDMMNIGVRIKSEWKTLGFCSSLIIGELPVTQRL